MQKEDPSKHEMVAGVIREGEQDSRIRFSLWMTRQGASFVRTRISLLENNSEPSEEEGDQS